MSARKTVVAGLFLALAGFFSRGGKPRPSTAGEPYKGTPRSIRSLAKTPRRRPRDVRVAERGRSDEDFGQRALQPESLPAYPEPEPNQVYKLQPQWR